MTPDDGGWNVVKENDVEEDAVQAINNLEMQTVLIRDCSKGVGYGVEDIESEYLFAYDRERTYSLVNMLRLWYTVSYAVICSASSFY